MQPLYEKVKKKIKGALTYPIVMFTVAISVMVFMLITYGVFGLFANIALGCNIIFIIFGFTHQLSPKI